jgi:hypothetical protein
MGFLKPLGRHRLPVSVSLIALLIVTTKPGNWIRVPFAEQAVSVSLPAIVDPGETIVLLAGHEPLSFLLPSFPPNLRFLRIDSTFTNPDQTSVRFNQVMRQRIANHHGRLLVLFIPSESRDVVARLADYGLVLHGANCATITSPIGAAPYALCAVGRQGPE